MNITIKSLFYLFLMIGVCYSQGLQDRLIAHYSFNGNANDMSGNGNNGVVFGATLTEDCLNSPNGAYYFDGVDDYIVVSDNEIFKLIDNKLTVVLRVKIYYLTNRFFIYKGDTQNNREYMMGLNIDSLASFGINNQGGWRDDQYGINSGTILEEDIWYHIVGCWDGTYQKIYINGVLKNISTPPVVIGDYDSDLYIGTYGGDISRYAINAIIDDIRIYNRALSDDEIGQLFTRNISANFSVDTTNGIAPLTVQFSDQSITSDSLVKINSWQWDFENDGVIDSEEQNPEWTYLENGLYTVKLTVSDSIIQASNIKENFIAVLSEKPLILSVDDIPDDQGGWVKVKFWRSIYDTDSLQGKINSAELYTIEIDDGSGWMAATSLVAYGKSQYSALVQTTKDATAEEDGLINFRVIAGMDEGNFVSEVVSGYSVDNFAPSVPQGLMANLGETNSIELNWDTSPDEDFLHFNVYRNIENYFDNSSKPIAQSTDNSFIDSQIDAGNSYYYTLKAIDFSGNKSGYSDVVSVQITSLSDESGGIPSTYFIKQNYPNPFNPVTIISYGLPKSSIVKITIFDVTGKEVQKLVNEKQGAGKYDLEWHGLDRSGNKVSSGLYLYEIKADRFRKVNKMVLIR